MDHSYRLAVWYSYQFALLLHEYACKQLKAIFSLYEEEMPRAAYKHIRAIIKLIDNIHRLHYFMCLYG